MLCYLGFRHPISVFEIFGGMEAIRKLDSQIDQARILPEKIIRPQFFNYDCIKFQTKEKVGYSVVDVKRDINVSK